MTTQNTPDNLAQVPEAVVDEEHKGFPVVWLLPLVALIVGAWLVFKAVSEKGPEVVIQFESAEGVVAAKTSIRYRDVIIGQVDNIDLSDDLSSVQVTATLHPGAKSYLTDATRFWVVRPRIGVAGVSGLGTLVSGAYIAMDPNPSGKPTRKFVGLEKPPIVTSDKEGTTYRLRAKKLGSLSVGSPIYFKQFDVGEVTDYKLAENHQYVDIGIFIQAPHDQFVHEGTRFWNAGGISVALDASGVKLEVESVVALLSGGIAFETLPDLADTPLAEKEHVFTLYDDHAHSLEQPITEVVTFMARFGQGVRGLSVGAPVDFRGVRIGTVRSIDMGPDPRETGVLVPVVVFDIEPERMRTHGLVDVDQKIYQEISQMERTRSLVKKGLRARLQTGNLVTGQLYVDIDMFPDAEPATLIETGQYPEIPTLPNPLEGILAGINRVLNKLEDAKLEETLANLNELMISTNSLMSTLEEQAPQLADELHTTMQQAHQTLRDASTTLSSLNSVASPEGQIGNELKNALRELSAAARSFRIMAEYIERHPEALIKGKGGTP